MGRAHATFRKTHHDTTLRLALCAAAIAALVFASREAAASGALAAPAAASVAAPQKVRHATRYFERRANRQARRFGDAFVVAGGAHEKTIALTFDDGPDPVFLPRLLAALAREKVPATFFLVGEAVDELPSLARRIVREGHAVGGHGASHVYGFHELPALWSFLDDVEEMAQSLRNALGFDVKLVRPPFGMVKDEQVRALAERGYKTIAWSVDGFDWRAGRNGAAQICATVAKNAHPGGIVLLHSSGAANGNTARALPCIVAKLKKEGYRFVTVPDLLAAQEPARRYFVPSPSVSSVYAPSRSQRS